MARPLAGLKILDFSTLLPGPYATQLLADMGADVLRVEAPGRPDLARTMPPFVDKGVSAIHATLNRNKRSVGLDLKKPEAVAIVHQLLNTYDVIVEQFRPGVMQRLGLDYDTLRKRTPRLIYCSITGYGQSGPLKDRAGHDINYLALSGLASYSGRQETGPVLSGTQIADIAGGSHHSVMGILAAVIERGHTGLGQQIDISMSDCALALNAMSGAAALASGHAPQAGAELLNGGIFYDYYRTSDNRWLSVGSLEPQFATGFFAALGHAEWSSRVMNREPGAQQVLKDDIQRLIGEQPLQHWVEVFAQRDVCVEPVLDVRQALEHPHFQERGMVVNVPLNPDSDQQVPQIANPIRFSASSGEYAQAGGPVGADNRAILRELGYDSDRIDQLTAEGVCG